MASMNGWMPQCSAWRWGLLSHSHHSALGLQLSAHQQAGGSKHSTLVSKIYMRLQLIPIATTPLGKTLFSLVFSFCLAT